MQGHGLDRGLCHPVGGARVGTAGVGRGHADGGPLKLGWASGQQLGRYAQLRCRVLTAIYARHRVASWTILLCHLIAWCFYRMEVSNMTKHPMGQLSSRWWTTCATARVLPAWHMSCWTVNDTCVFCCHVHTLRDLVVDRVFTSACKNTAMADMHGACRAASAWQSAGSGGGARRGRLPAAAVRRCVAIPGGRGPAALPCPPLLPGALPAHVGGAWRCGRSWWCVLWLPCPRLSPPPHY